MPSFKSILVNVYKTVSVEATATNRSNRIYDLDVPEVFNRLVGLI